MAGDATGHRLIDEVREDYLHALEVLFDGDTDEQLDTLAEIAMAKELWSLYGAVSDEQRRREAGDE